MIWMSDSGMTFSILPHLDTCCSIPPDCQPLSQAGSSPNRLRPLARQLAKQKACEGGRDTGRALDVACVTRASPRVSSFQRLPPRHSANIAHNVVETPANIRSRRHVERDGGDRPPSTSTQTLRHHSRCCGIQLSKKAPLRGLSLRLPMGVGSSEPTCPNLQMRVS